MISLGVHACRSAATHAVRPARSLPLRQHKVLQVRSLGLARVNLRSSYAGKAAIVCGTAIAGVLVHRLSPGTVFAEAPVRRSVY